MGGVKRKVMMLKWLEEGDGDAKVTRGSEGAKGRC